MDNHSNVGKQVFPKGKSTSDHRTPLDLFYSLGDFDLDVASNEDNHLCEYYFTEEDNGLEQSWDASRVWCNPPYNNISEWLNKGIHEVHYAKNCDEVVYLLPARTSTKWFKLAWLNAQKVSFIHGRLNFIGPYMNTDLKATAPFPSVLIYINRKNSPQCKRIVNLISRTGELID